MWLNYISFSRYANQARVVNQFRAVDTLCPNSPVAGTGCTYRTGNDYLKYVGFENWEWWYSISKKGDLRRKVTKREVYKRERITSNALHLCTISMYLCGDELEGGWGELAFVSLPYERSPPMQTAASSR